MSGIARPAPPKPVPKPGCYMFFIWYILLNLSNSAATLINVL